MRALAAWNRFWFEKIGGSAFALVRIAFSVTALITLMELAPLLAEHYTSDGYFPIDSARQWSWGNLIGLLHVEALDGLAQVTVVFTLLLFSLTLLGLGWHTRTAAFASFVLLLWFQTRNPTFLNGGDEVLRLTAFYLFLGYLVIPPGERTLSIDRRIGSPAGASAEEVWLGGTMPAWPVRMIQIQICILYGVAGWWKLAGQSWWSADAVYYALQNPQVARILIPAPSWTEPVFLLASVSVAWWEFLFPLLYSWGRSRRVALGFGVLLHVGILLTMNIGFFPLVVLATYPAMVGAPACDRWLRRVLGRVRGSKPQPAHQPQDGLSTVPES